MNNAAAGAAAAAAAAAGFMAWNFVVRAAVNPGCGRVASMSSPVAAAAAAVPVSAVFAAAVGTVRGRRRNSFKMWEN